jgi:2',3'-cyclic-nucleotide 2'-phosphodiesterase (5'-nucleotidase family)
VIGYVTSTMPALIRGATAAPFEFRSGLSGVADALDSVRAKSPDFIVIVAHAGGGCGDAAADAPSTASACKGEMVDLAEQLDSAGVDLIIGGHEHTSTQGVVHGIPIVRASSQGRAISIVDLVRTPDGAHHFTLSRDTAYDDRVTPDPRLLALMRPYLARVDSIGHVPIATLRDSLVKGQGALGVAIADAMRQAASADVGVINSGGIRAPLAAGTVTYDDVYRVLPFGNTVARLRMTAGQLRAALEPALAKTSYFFAGVRTTYDAAAPAGKRVVLAGADGRPMPDEEMLTVAVTDFAVDGGDYFATPRAVPVEQLGVTVLDALIAYLKRTSP